MARNIYTRLPLTLTSFFFMWLHVDFYEISVLDALDMTKMWRKSWEFRIILLFILLDFFFPLFYLIINPRKQVQFKISIKIYNKNIFHVWIENRQLESQSFPVDCVMMGKSNCLNMKLKVVHYSIHLLSKPLQWKSNSRLHFFSQTIILIIIRLFSSIFLNFKIILI